MANVIEPVIRRAYDARRAGDAAAALVLYRAAAAKTVDPATRAHCLRHIGDLEREAGRIAEAQSALREAEALYRSAIDDPLSLANVIRLRALTEDSADLWEEARALFEIAARETGLDLGAAVEECRAHLAR